ncbi:MAG TPA: AMP-binding protein [Pseudobdellovibrionaceae bacterium]|nr:AMP-binding protein [Pseudobdellovibrionaceae bacterium]
MNTVSLFVEQAERHPDRMALWLPGSAPVNFRELSRRSGGAQNHLKSKGLKKGDSVLLMDPLSPRLYGMVTACLAQGACILFVEPWMKADRIALLIEKIQPRYFIAGWKGRIWGLRIPAIRRIPHWIWPQEAWEQEGDVQIEDVSADTPGILTFTSGTTGLPKGVLRAHGYMRAQHQVLNDALGFEEFSSPDLCIFANFALANLASGRGSVIVPPGWKKKDFRAVQNLSENQLPETLTSGPAFLKALLSHGGLPSLRSIHIGGALTDTSLFEEGFHQWPTAHWSHIYGSSEAEPVAVSDAHEAVQKSKDRGYFQTLYLGKPVPPLSSRVETDTVWISGPHVGPEYWGGDSPENRVNKKRENGVLWHNMGDRVLSDDQGWWYMGRSQQDRELFLTEQKVFKELDHSRAFIQPTAKGPWLFGEDLTPDLFKAFSLAGQTNLKIVRDARHRARIDRPASLSKGAPWALG